MNYAVIFAGGVGSRMNSKAKPKQFLEIHGKPIMIHTIEHFDLHPEIDAICVVCVSDWIEYLKSLLQRFGVRKVKWIVPGGSTALESQYNGLKAIGADQDDIVLIHDGVRPLINEKTISDCILGVEKYGSAITVVPAFETIVQQDANRMITNTYPRSDCMLARAPQCFRYNDIIAAHELARSEGKSFIDSTSMMLEYGHSVHTVEGPSENIKVTTPADFYICRALLDAREDSQLYGL